MNNQKKMGRPTTDPKGSRIGVRLNEQCEDILNRYMEQENVSIAEAVRHGIMKLEEEMKK